MKINFELTDDDVNRIAEASARLVIDAFNRGEITGPPPAALPALIDEKAAAQMLAVSLSTIRSLARSGALTKHKIGNSTRYDPDQVKQVAKTKKAAG